MPQSRPAHQSSSSLLAIGGVGPVLIQRNQKVHINGKSTQSFKSINELPGAALIACALVVVFRLLSAGRIGFLDSEE